MKWRVWYYDLPVHDFGVGVIITRRERLQIKKRQGHPSPVSICSPVPYHCNLALYRHHAHLQ